MQLIKELENRKHFLEDVIHQLEYNLSRYPAGTIQFAHDYDYENNVRFFRHLNGKDIYLSEKTNKALIKALLQKRYETKALKKYSKELKLINHLMDFKKDIPELIPDNLNGYVRKIELPKNEILRSFDNNSHGSSSNRTGQYRVTTKEGVLVKSKAEQIIADELFDSKIPFKYELGLNCRDNSYRSPDFTIMNPSTGKVFYWEHFGMMDRSDYVRDKVDKMNSYSLTGIIPGDNLILTIADDRKLEVRGFTNQVRRIIDKVLT